MLRHRRLAVIAGAVLVPLVAGGALLQSRASREGAQLFNEVLGIVGNRYVDTVSAGGLYEKAARGLVRELNDPYSELLSPKQLQSFTTRTGGRYGGVGMQIENQQGNITVSRVFPHTPAERAGIREGDRIIWVDTAATKGWSINQVSEALLGTPGTKVNVRFGRPGVAEPIAVTFTRAIVRIPAVNVAMMLDGKVGYVQFQQFNETASQEVKDAVERLQREGAKGVVLDMRENPGGILDQAIEVSNLFLDRGQTVASVRGRNAETQTYAGDDRPISTALPLVVMVNQYSASAAEIVAGALQDHDRALVVGVTSYGKGLVQSVFPLDGGWALKLTTAKWYTPSGRLIQKERQLNSAGDFVEVHPDSLESDSVRKARPAFRSDAGRVVYGGGAITPDITVKPDTITTAEQQLVKAITPKSQDVYVVLYDYALDLKSTISGPDFQYQPAWREEFYRRLQAKGVSLDRATFDRASGYVDRLIENRVARLAFGDSAALRRDIPEDRQLVKALDVLRRASSQRDLFAIAQQENARTAAAPPRAAQPPKQ
jgi:carboxyl-terminal processing protease